MAYQTRHVTGWVGWVWFAGLLMIMSGVFNIISGLYAVLNSDVYVRMPNRLLFFDVTSWGWAHLVFGIVLFLVGLAVSVGQTWARVVAAILVMLNAMTQLTWIAVNPWWSLAVIALDVLVLYALIVHGREAKVLES
ncbi:membrane protein [Nonomuraea rosea]|uniref:Membrane protein n=1 Tax=Nonomuraea rosea TaxID=638574 RepID=A0ABP6WJW8_9ACTN